MIRVALTTDDLERLQVANTPDFGYELALGGSQLADRTCDRRLAAWRLEVARSWNPHHNRLFDLYTHLYIPAFFDQIAHAAPAGIDPESPPATAHLRDLARSGALTPFTRALADGHAGSVGTLNGILTDFRTRAVDPYRRRITSAVATASATASVRSTIGGTDDLLNSLHPSIRWDGRELRLNTVVDAEESLEGRPLIFQPTALATRIMFDPLDDSVTVIYPATTGAITPDPDLDAPPRGLVSLLGATRAAALVTVVRTPALTTGRLAATLGVSAAAASRHATVLRESGLIATVRNGQTVHHAPTRLGTDLVHGSTTDNQPT
ncbi:ArsR/SmtB family transcription factor [Kitasatospora kifunensis]|uniref:DNA-binding transcriptional ArsR family regulator n=1 Tax=Kitasatospora kifunensis TaxID=58351 RepID=A0A7W7W0G3_KITKI|nr:helix-turn-helix domain-containing protein [Kitasatospora kifunensis]MBB4928724.1 DNA-binding transcriptional ArsR family regulator [Kitasatospora kifunensis]